MLNPYIGVYLILHVMLLFNQGVVIFKTYSNVHYVSCILKVKFRK